MTHPPDRIADGLAGRSFTPIHLGESGAQVWRCGSSSGAAVFLKTAPVTAQLDLAGEAERLRWMRSKNVPVPPVVDAGVSAGTEYLVMEAVPGLPASAAEWLSSREAVVVAIGRALARLHETDTQGCPFDQRISVQLDRARQRLEAGLVREDDFDDCRAGQSASGLFEELLATAPAREDVVLTHGDFCLPNVILQRGASGSIHVEGFIDCGRAGIADRHQDIALAIRSITAGFGNEYVASFLEAYGLSHPDAARVAFFTLLDEFF